MEEAALQNVQRLCAMSASPTGGLGSKKEDGDSQASTRELSSTASTSNETTSRSGSADGEQLALVCPPHPDCPIDSGPQGEGQSQKECDGCGRRYGVSRSYFEPEETVQWQLPGGRGKWCSDCFTVWRTYFKEETPLSVFRPWLDRERENTTIWRLALVSWACLRNEGMTSIRKPMIAARLASLRFVLSKMDAHFFSLLHDICPTACAGAALMITDSTPVPDAPPAADAASARPTCKYRKRTDAIMDEFRSKVGHLEREQWETKAKEAHMSSLLAKLSAVYHEAMGQGAKESATVAEQLCTMLGATKNFLKRLREYNKSRMQHNNFMDLAALAVVFEEKLEQSDVKPPVNFAPTLKMLLAKARLYRCLSIADEDGQTFSLPTALELVIEKHGLFAALQKASAEGDTDVNAWMYAVMQKSVILRVVRIAPTEGLDDLAAARVSRECRSAAETLARGGGAADVSDARALLEMMALIAQASTGEAAALVTLDLRAALKSLEAKHLRLFLEELRSLEFFVAMWSNAMAVCERSSQDCVADDKLASATAFLQKLPQFFSDLSGDLCQEPTPMILELCDGAAAEEALSQEPVPVVRDEPSEQEQAAAVVEELANVLSRCAQAEGDVEMEQAEYEHSEHSSQGTTLGRGGGAEDEDESSVRSEDPEEPEGRGGSSERPTRPASQALHFLFHAELLDHLVAADVLMESLDMINESLHLWSKIHLEEKTPELTVWAERMDACLGVLDSILTALLLANVEASQGRCSDGEEAVPEAGGAEAGSSAPWATDETTLQKVFLACITLAAKIPGASGWLLPKRIAEVYEPGNRLRSLIAEMMKSRARRPQSMEPEALLHQWKRQRDAGGDRGYESFSSILQTAQSAASLKEILGNYEHQEPEPPLPPGTQVALVPGAEVPEAGGSGAGSSAPGATVVISKLTSLAHHASVWGDEACDVLRAVIVAQVKDVYNACSLDAIHCGAMDVAVTDSGSWETQVRHLVDDSKMRLLVKDVSRAFLSSSTKVPFERDLLMLQHLVATLPDQDGLTFSPTVELLRMYTQTSVVAAGLSYLAQRYGAESEKRVPPCEGPRMNSDISKCLHTVESVSSMALAGLDRLDRVVREQSPALGLLDDAQLLVPPPGDVETWMAMVVGKVLPAAKSYFFDLFLEHLRLQTDQLVEMTPTVDAYISDDAFMHGMAKRHLLQWNLRARFSDSVLTMHELLANTRRTYVDFGEERPIFEAAEKAAQKAAENGMRVVTIIASVSLLLERADAPDASEQAAKFLNTPDVVLPGALRSELSALEKKDPRPRKRARVTT